MTTGLQDPRLLSDDELVETVKRADSSDLRAFETLVKRYQDKVTANCRHLSGSADDAQDLAQEVFVRAYYGLARFEGRAKFSTWLQRIKVNHCINFLKKKKGKTFTDIDETNTRISEELSVQPDATRNLQAADDRTLIRQVLDEMTATLRIPLVMRDMDDLSYQEIADELGIGLSAVKMRIKRGREEFRRLYEQFSARMAS